MDIKHIHTKNNLLRKHSHKYLHILKFQHSSAKYLPKKREGNILLIAFSGV